MICLDRRTTFGVVGPCVLVDPVLVLLAPPFSTARGAIVCTRSRPLLSAAFGRLVWSEWVFVCGVAKRLFTSTDLRTGEDLLVLLRALELPGRFSETLLERPRVVFDWLRPNDTCERTDEPLLEGRALLLGVVL